MLGRGRVLRDRWNEKHTATALASIAMLDEKAAARIPSPA
jgi:hypothetical protein